MMTQHQDFDAFVETIARLRAPDGCPWDREQTHQSIAHNMIEEAYESVDAIETGNVAHLREELGDVLLQVVLQAQIAADAGEFDIDDVCRVINEKMIRRHPHVFGDASAQSAEDVSDIWAKVKMEEHRSAEEAPGDAPREGLLDSVPSSFPALMQAQKISRKAVAAGFEWDSEEDVWDKVAEEVKSGKRYILFPEGSYDFNNRNHVCSFKAGSFKIALKAKAPIIPVALIDSYKVFNSFNLGPVTTQVHYLKPILFEEYGTLKTKEIADLVRERIQEKINEVLPQKKCGSTC